MKMVKKFAWLLSFLLIVSAIFGNVNLKVTATGDTTVSGGDGKGVSNNFELKGANAVSNGIFTAAHGKATLNVGGTLYSGDDGKVQIPALDTEIIVTLTANEGRKGVLRFGGDSALAFQDSMIATSGQVTTYKFTLSGIGVTDLNTFVAVNLDFEDNNPRGEENPGSGQTNAISFVVEGDATAEATMEYSTDGGTTWTSFTRNTTLESDVDSAKVKVIFDSSKVMVQGNFATGGIVASGIEYEVTQKQTYNIQIDKKVCTVTWAYDEKIFGDDGTVKNGKVEITSAVKSGGSEIWSGIEPALPGENNNSQNEEGGRVAIIPGSMVTVKIVPDYGYQFTAGTLNGQTVTAEAAVSTFTFTMPETNLHLSALFEKTEDVISCSGATGVTGGSITGGGNVITSGNLQLTVTDSNITDEKKSELQASTAASGVQVDQWLEVDLAQFVNKGNSSDKWTTDLEELSQEITVTLNVGTGYDANKEYVVVREHNGVYERIPATYDKAAGTLIFQSDKFSGYAVGTLITADDILGTIQSSWTNDLSDAASTVTSLTTAYGVENIAAAVQTSDGTVNQNLLTKLSALENDYNTEKGVTLEATLVNSAVADNVNGTVEVVGAGFNTSANSSVQLVINEKDGNGITIDSAYSKAVQLNISLYKKTESDSMSKITGTLRMPVTITMPVPAGLDASRLVILHDKDGDGTSDETIVPAVENGKVTFTVTGFSNFAFAEKASSSTPAPTPTPAYSSDNTDDENSSSDEFSGGKKLVVDVEYIVVKGDTLSKIAKKNKLTLAALFAMNPQIKNINLIYPGQKIVVGRTTRTLTDQAVASTPTNAEYYVVQKGDCLYWIAWRNRLSLSQLAALNPEAVKQKYIYAGQKIRIR